MATRKTKGPGFTADSETARAVSESAQKIWLAGLGAFERAKADGPKMFEVLVEQGKDFAERVRGAADEALKGMRDMIAANARASGRRGGPAKKRSAVKASTVKRKAKRAVSSAKRAATGRTRGTARKTKKSL